MRRLPAATAAVIAIASVAGAASGPALDYTLNCEGCHRADGTGTPGSVPALRDSVARFLAAPGGREYLARVPGVAQAPLEDAALAAAATDAIASTVAVAARRLRMRYDFVATPSTTATEQLTARLLVPKHHSRSLFREV